MSDPTYLEPPADHSVKVPHLVFGLLFLGVAGIWALGTSDLIDGEQLAVLAPAVLVVAGVIGLVASLASGRNRSRRNAVPTHDPAYDEGYSAHEEPETTGLDITHDTTTETDDTDPTREIR